MSSLLYPELRLKVPEIRPETWPHAPLDPTDPWYAVGSCFAQRAAKALKRHLFPVRFGAAGSLYHPRSIKNWLTLVCVDPESRRELIARHAREDSGIWHHPWTSGSISAHSLEALTGGIESLCDAERQWLLQSKIFLLTLGSARLLRDSPSRQVWGNRHRLPSAGFERSVSSPQEIEEDLHSIITLINTHSEAQIILSVSPVRHYNIDILDNSWSKALLLSCAHAARQKRELFYFPAFEIVIDELRDYRWYDDKLYQLSPAAFGEILKRLLDTVLSPESLRYLETVTRLAKMLLHVPNQETAARGGIPPHVQKAETILQELQKCYPGLPKDPEVYRMILRENQDDYRQ